ncbi:MAG: hypothetical protein AB7I27_01055 [Bacteriovoracaceae bacterium]
MSRLVLLLTSFLLSTSIFAQLPNDYQKFSAAKKQSLLLANVEKTKYATLPPIPAGGWGSILAKLKSFMTLGETFNEVSDEMPASRGKNKLIHSSGSVAGVIYIPSEQYPTFTGIFSSGGLGVVRLSLAGSPESLGSFTPGMGVKILVDGKPSVNVTVMYSLNGQGENTNFFANVFSNRIPKPTGFALNALFQWFKLFAKNPLVLGVDHFAKVKSNGEVVDQPVVPYQLLFQPVLKLNEKSTRDFREDLKVVRGGTLIYILYATRNDRDKPFEIGRFYTTSDMIPSEYGDHQLFFQHRE